MKYVTKILFTVHNLLKNEDMRGKLKIQPKKIVKNTSKVMWSITSYITITKNEQLQMKEIFMVIPKMYTFHIITCVIRKLWNKIQKVLQFFIFSNIFARRERVKL